MTPVSVLVVFLSLGFASAQFAFNFNPFEQFQQQQEQRSGAPQWAAMVDNVQCSEYLCPVTLDCVRRPIDCPCPDPQDIKCRISDSSGNDESYVCVRGNDACAQVEWLLLKGSTRSKTRN